MFVLFFKQGNGSLSEFHGRMDGAKYKVILEVEASKDLRLR